MDPQKEQLFRIVLIAAVVLGAIVFYFIYTFISQQRKILKWQNIRMKAEIESIENERRRIAADLHDEIGPMLSAVKIQVNYFEPEGEEEKAVLQKSSNQIDQVIRRFREISYNLLPNTLVRKGLIKGVEEFIVRMEHTGKLQIKLDADDVKLPADKEVNIYRIIQEIIHNSIKHSQANQLTINLKVQNGLLLLHAQDDGVGFLYEEKKLASKGLGLLSLENRVEVLEGKLTVQSSPGKGVLYLIQMPIEPI